MVLIFTIATVAATAIKMFNRLPAQQSRQIVSTISQGTSVMLALTTAVQWVIQGLQGLTRLSQPMIPTFGGTQIQVGRPATVAA